MAKDGLKIVLLYSNKTKSDILVKEELDIFEQINTEHLKIYHTLTRHDETKEGEWPGLKGRITEEMII